MADMQSEILFIAKFGGLILAFGTHYFSVIKPIAVFNERQKVVYKLIQEMKVDQEKMEVENQKTRDAFIRLQTEHEINNCKVKKS